MEEMPLDIGNVDIGEDIWLHCHYRGHRRRT